MTARCLTGLESFRVALQTMDALVAIQFPTEVHQVSTVDLLGEDDRHASRRLSRSPWNFSGGPG
jgi:hypothetical protein